MKRLAANGTREITLLGQNVNAYHGAGPDGRDWTLARLLRRLAQLPAIERLRYTTSHPLDMDDELIALFADEPKLMPYLHLPFQAGSDRILKAMNRKHSARRIRGRDRQSARRRGPTSRCPQILLSAFPARPMRISRPRWRLRSAIRFAQAFTFKYSARPGTPAADLDGQVPEEVKRERLHQLQRLIDRDRARFRPGNGRAQARCTVRGTGAETRSDRRAFTLPAGGACGGTRGVDRPDCRG